MSFGSSRISRTITSEIKLQNNSSKPPLYCYAYLDQNLKDIISSRLFINNWKFIEQAGNPEDK